jgi:hypothetical protein
MVIDCRSNIMPMNMNSVSFMMIRMPPFMVLSEIFDVCSVPEGLNKNLENTTEVAHKYKESNYKNAEHSNEYDL